MGIPLIVVDAFTDHPFAGNPAAVVLLEAPAPDAWMQAVAAEVNLADTAFVVPRPDGDHDLRWFTPAKEVDLCGHATLATGHLLGGHQRFWSRSGRLETTVGADGSVQMDLPAHPVAEAPTDGWAEVLGVAPGRVVGAWASDAWDLVELASAEDVEGLAPRRDALLTKRGHAIVVADTTGSGGAAGAAGVDTDTTDRGEGADTVARVFAPSAGIDEDPVTGSAHCVIGPWIAARTGRTRFACRQASARGGHLEVVVDGDRVRIAGRAVTIIRGELLVGPDLATR